MGKCHYCENDATDTCQHCDNGMCDGCKFNCEATVDEGGGYYVDCWWSVCKECKDKHWYEHV